jgi:hypothetical protein
MSDESLDEVYEYLAALGEEREYALRIAGLAWQESWRQAERRADVAEEQNRLLREHVLDKREGRLTPSPRFRSRPAPNRPPRPSHERRVEEHRREHQWVVSQLYDAIKDEHSARLRADEERARADAAERRCDELLAEIGHLRGLLDF